MTNIKNKLLTYDMVTVKNKQLVPKLSISSNCTLDARL